MKNGYIWLAGEEGKTAEKESERKKRTRVMVS